MQSQHFMANWWGNNEETVETASDFIFGGSQITADGDCSHEIKICLLLGRKVMTNLDSILKSRDITLPTKVHLVKAMVFPVVTYGCESWAIQKAEHRRIDAFELWCWRRLLRVPWTARKSNQPILKEIYLEYSLEYLVTWCKEPTNWKRPWCWARLKAGGEGDDRGWDGWMASLTRWTRVWVSSNWTGKPRVLQSMGLQRVRHNWVTELNWCLLHWQADSLPLGLPRKPLETWYYSSFNPGGSGHQCPRWEIFPQRLSFRVGPQVKGIYQHQNFLETAICHKEKCFTLTEYSESELPNTRHPEGFPSPWCRREAYRRNKSQVVIIQFYICCISGMFQKVLQVCFIWWKNQPHERMLLVPI